MNNMLALHKRRATSADEEFMRRLHKAANQDVIIRQFGTWDDEVQARLFSQKWVLEAFEILLMDGRPIGCIRVEDHPEHVSLADIQILPEFQGRGLGSKLIQHEMARARSIHKPLRLQVLTSNHRARDLYLRLGLEIIGNTDRHLILSVSPIQVRRAREAFAAEE